MYNLTAWSGWDFGEFDKWRTSQLWVPISSVLHSNIIVFMDINNFASEDCHHFHKAMYADSRHHNNSLLESWMFCQPLTVSLQGYITSTSCQAVWHAVSIKPSIHLVWSLHTLCGPHLPNQQGTTMGNVYCLYVYFATVTIIITRCNIVIHSHY